MTKCKNPGEKSLSKCLAALQVKWFFWRGAAACTEVSERNIPGSGYSQQPSPRASDFFGCSRVKGNAQASPAHCLDSNPFPKNQIFSFLRGSFILSFMCHGWVDAASPVLRKWGAAGGGGAGPWQRRQPRAWGPRGSGREREGPGGR